MGGIVRLFAATLSYSHQKPVSEPEADKRALVPGKRLPGCAVCGSCGRVMLRSRAVIERFRRNIEISGPADRVKGNVRLLEQRQVLQTPKDTFIEIRPHVKQARLPGAEFQLQVKIISRMHEGDRFRGLTPIASFLRERHEHGLHCSYKCLRLRHRRCREAPLQM